MASNKPNSGALFKNDKRTTDQHPNAKGQALIGGVEYWISAWTNETNDGQKYQALKFEPKEKQEAPRGKAARDDDPPF